jgi:hypothetical protein
MGEFMYRDKKLTELTETWNQMESLVAREPLEGAVAVEAAPKSEPQLNIDGFKNLIKVIDSPVEVDIKLGWLPLISIEEEDGRWYTRMDSKEFLSMDGYASKQEAIDKVIEYFSKE